MNNRPIILELTEELSNLISAGEVVERPVSIVKELVENSLDANATSIKIELYEGGLNKIIVSDNGIGMTKNEIPIALKRHATSKIKSSTDLFNISTLGFRGEALPSIASVSKMSISSSTNELDGIKMIFQGGKLISSQDISMTIGTKIEVEDLFYNTPARSKHLSTNYLELSHITSFVNKFAIAHSDIAISLYNNGKCLLQTDGKNNIELIISETYGTEVAHNLIAFENKNDLYHIKGLTSNTSINRSNRNSINIFINGRVIKNQSIIYAITDAYKTILPVGKYPITILEIECLPSLIDVNVHPSKLEIRFTDEYNLKNMITKTIGMVLAKKELIIDQLKIERVIQEGTPLTEVETPKMDNSSSKNLWDMFEDYDDEDDTDENNDEVQTVEEEITLNKYEESSLIVDKENTFFQNLRYIGQYLKTYLLMENDETLYLIDQHAAMERFMYEKISKEISQDNKNTYELLVPIQLEYNISVMPLIKEHSKEIHDMGIQFEEFGNNTIMVRIIPTWIPKGVEVEFIRDIINHIINNLNISKGKMYDSLAKTLSCKKSIKANMSITELEVQELMKKLDQCTMPYTCPHGRPTIIKFTKYELEKMFKRVM